MRAVTAGAGCVQVTVRRTGVGPDLVACPALGLLDLQFDLGGGADLLFVGPDDPLGATPYTVTASTGAGHDAVAISAAGAVTADLGAGSDELTVGSTLGPVSVVGGPGRDFLHAGGPAAVVFDGGKGGDLFTSGPAPDRLIGGEGPDRFSFYGRDPELLLTDELQCGPGDDTVDVQPVPGAGVDCPAEIVLPRRARLGDATVGVRVAVGEIARVRLVVYAQRDSGRVDLTRRTTRTLKAGARTLTLRLTDRGRAAARGRGAAHRAPPRRARRRVRRHPRRAHLDRAPPPLTAARATGRPRARRGCAPLRAGGRSPGTARRRSRGARPRRAARRGAGRTRASP